MHSLSQINKKATSLLCQFKENAASFISGCRPLGLIDNSKDGDTLERFYEDLAEDLVEDLAGILVLGGVLRLESIAFRADMAAKVRVPY